MSRLAGQIADHYLNEMSMNEEELSAYQKFFKATLSDFGVSSPDELEGDKKQEFFDKVDSGWKAKKETD